MTGAKRDRLFSSQREPNTPFRFDQEVAEVFDDMIRRSVPGYEAVLAGIATLGRKYAQPRTLAYDLGCSLGSASLALQHALNQDQLEAIEALDFSAPMVERAAHRFTREARADGPTLQAHREDITRAELRPASIVILNFTLQFVDPSERDALLTRIHRALVPGGALILSEKCTTDQPQDEARFNGLHDEYRRLHGYSELEIAQKRRALERVLIPETVGAHEQRLRRVGFTVVQVWFQCFNFHSLLALKG